MLILIAYFVTFNFIINASIWYNFSPACIGALSTVLEILTLSGAWVWLPWGYRMPSRRSGFSVVPPPSFVRSWDGRRRPPRTRRPATGDFHHLRHHHPLTSDEAVDEIDALWWWSRRSFQPSRLSAEIPLRLSSLCEIMVVTLSVRINLVLFTMGLWIRLYSSDGQPPVNLLCQVELALRDERVAFGSGPNDGRLLLPQMEDLPGHGIVGLRRRMQTPSTVVCMINEFNKAVISFELYGSTKMNSLYVLIGPHWFSTMHWLKTSKRPNAHWSLNVTQNYNIKKRASQTKISREYTEGMQEIECCCLHIAVPSSLFN